MRILNYTLIKNLRRLSSQRRYSNDSHNDSEIHNTHLMSQKTYWEKFYGQHNQFEWLLDFKKHLKEDELSDSVPKTTAFMLDIGCGTSSFSSDFQSSLKQSSFLICSDFSSQALSILKNNSSQSSLIDYVQCDCLHLPFRDDLFDVALDKGLLDSLLKSKQPESAIRNSVMCMSGLLRLLESNKSDNNRSVLIQITDEVPELRLSLIDQVNTESSRFYYSFKEIELSDSSSLYVYFVYKL